MAARTATAMIGAVALALLAAACGGSPNPPAASAQQNGAVA